MGLAQKRILQEYQQEKFPKWQSQFDEAVGKKVAFDVKWDTLQSDEYSDKDQYFSWFDKVYFAPLVKALKAVASDDMGKSALKSGLKKIVIDGTDGISGNSSQFTNGTLTINHKFYSNVDDGDDRANIWQKLLEDAL